VRAGILDAESSGQRMVEDAIDLDPILTQRQKNALRDIYRSFIANQEEE
jgi:hypothetical protein